MSGGTLGIPAGDCGAGQFLAHRADFIESKTLTLSSLRGRGFDVITGAARQARMPERRPQDHEFIRRGLPYEDGGARQILQLRSLGVTDVVQIPRTDVGTEGEGQVLPSWCDEHQLRTIVLVATKDHSRRLRRVLDRVMKGHPTRVTVQPARYSSFDPDRWWETRGGVRTEIVELQKLLLDVVLHPMSF